MFEEHKQVGVIKMHMRVGLGIIHHVDWLYSWLQLWALAREDEISQRDCGVSRSLHHCRGGAKQSTTAAELIRNWLRIPNWFARLKALTRSSTSPVSSTTGDTGSRRFKLHDWTVLTAELLGMRTRLLSQRLLYLWRFTNRARLLFRHRRSRFAQMIEELIQPCCLVPL